MVGILVKLWIKSRHQVACDKLCDLRTDGVSRSPSFRSVGLIQSFAKPIIDSRSLPDSHLIPSVWHSDDIGTIDVDGR